MTRNSARWTLAVVGLLVIVGWISPRPEHHEAQAKPPTYIAPEGIDQTAWTNCVYRTMEKLLNSRGWTSGSMSRLSVDRCGLVYRIWDGPNNPDWWRNWSKGDERWWKGEM